MCNETIVMHYLPGAYLKEIIECGYLDVTPKKENLRGKEKPIAWFTTSEVYPPTAYKPVVLSDGTQHMLTNLEMHELLGGVFRLAGSNKTMKCYPWSILKTVAKIPTKLRKGLVGYAKSVGEKPSDWYGSLERVEIGMLLLQKWNGTGWDTVPFSLDSVNPIAARFDRQSAHKH
ncbi:MAG: hypothetical protein DRI24_18210 [Deltaproteobacteria bacterium]|nr:MAG: hypothetical protein DRI24_18210 [Deltaproteobacteria bacterium]